MTGRHQSYHKFKSSICALENDSVCVTVCSCVLCMWTTEDIDQTCNKLFVLPKYLLVSGVLVVSGEWRGPELTTVSVLAADLK